MNWTTETILKSSCSVVPTCSELFLEQLAKARPLFPYKKFALRERNFTGDNWMLDHGTP